MQTSSKPVSVTFCVIASMFTAFSALAAADPESGGRGSKYMLGVGDGNGTGIEQQSTADLGVQSGDLEGAIAGEKLGPGCPGNLVPNPGFETFTTCPNSAGQVSFAPPWFLPTYGSSDYFNACAGSGTGVFGVPTNVFGSEPAHGGVAYMGFRIYGNVPPNTTTDYREYLEVPLLASLVAAQTYQISFWVSLSEASSQYGLKEISAYFRAGPLYSATSVQLNVTPQFTNPGGPVTITSGWVQVLGTFVAAGGEDHMIIGNFKTDAASTVTPAGAGCCPVSYYYIDDVCLRGQAGTLTGACCVPGAAGFNCVIATHPDCDSMGGAYQGNGTTCAAPGPCAGQVFGACCTSAPGPNHCQITSPAQCTALGGTYLGNNTTCTGDPCNPPTGACCYDNGAGGALQCTITTAVDCTTNWNGTYLGDGSVCTPDPCNVQGACCYSKAGFPNNFCMVTTQDFCTNQLLGTYLGNFSVCPADNCNPPPLKGACCYQIAGSTSFTCATSTVIGCASYFNSTFMGPGTTCIAGLCEDSPLGACCYLNPSGTAYVCVLATQDDCTDDLNGLYQGNFTTCQPFPCDPPSPIGACCYQDLPNPTIFCAVVTQADCLQNFPNSTWQGAGVPCNPNPCADPDLVGACCYQGAAGMTCIITSNGDCVGIYNGTYFGNGSTCSPNPCVPTGACCYDNPTIPGMQCIIVTASECSHIYIGVYQGNGTSCTPNPCNPTGACCFKDGPQAFYVCTITTQSNCLTLPQSTWLGAGSTCSPSPCPRTGACCFYLVGSTVQQCVVTTQTECQQTLGGLYLGDNVPCSVNACPDCVKPPPNMVGWWTLDELAGGVAHDSIASHHGAYQPSTATGPTPIAGVVNGALNFDGVNDFVQVPHSAALDFNCGSFTIDAWIRPLSLGGGIVCKDTGALLGYDFYMDSTGKLVLQHSNGTGGCPVFSTASIATNVWTHVAVTSTASPTQRNVQFYINGAFSSGAPHRCVCTGNFAPLVIGRRSFNNDYFHGRIDEVEIFNRALTSQEIAAIYNAGSDGKCKHHCHVDWDWPFCLNSNQVTVTFQVCNDSPLPHPYSVSFSGLPVNLPNCTIAGPTVFTPLFTNPVNVPGNTCVNLQVKINRPVGMTAVLQIGCYDITVTNLDTLHHASCHGSVQDRRDLCATVSPCCLTLGSLPVGIATPFVFDLTNTTATPMTFPYRIEAMDSESMAVSQRISLNGLPPGTRYIGNLTLQPGQSSNVPITVQYLSHHELGFDDIVFFTDTNGDSEYEPLISIGTSSSHPACRADIAPPLRNGFVNVDDLLAVINSWGPCPQPCPPNGGCPADIVPNCFVNVDDLLAVINGWGGCP